MSDLKDALAQAEIVKLLMDFFGWEAKTKVRLWLNTPNPLLRGVKPMEMIEQGRSDKLLKFIQAILKENKRP